MKGLKNLVVIFMFLVILPSLMWASVNTIDTNTVKKLIASEDTAAYPVIALFYEKEQKYDSALFYWYRAPQDTMARKHIKIIQELKKLNKR